MKSSLLPSDKILKTKETLDRIQFEKFIETNLPDRNADDKDIKPFSDFFVRFFNLSLDIGDTDELENYAISRSTLADDSLKEIFFTNLFKNEAKKFCQLARTTISENDSLFEEFFNHYLNFFIEKLTNEYKELKQEKERGETVKDPENFLKCRKIFFNYILTQADDLKVFFLDNQRFCEEPLLKSFLANYPDFQGQNTNQQSTDDSFQINRIAQLEQELKRSIIFIGEKDKQIKILRKIIDEQGRISKAQDSSNSIQIESRKNHDQIVKNLQEQIDKLEKAFRSSLDETTELKKELAKIKFELKNNGVLIYQKTQENSVLTQDNIALTQENYRLTQEISRLTQDNIALIQENSRLQKQVQNEARSGTPFNRDPQQKKVSFQEESREELSKRKLLELLQKSHLCYRKILNDHNLLKKSSLRLKHENDQLSKLLLSKSSEAKEAGRSPARQDQDFNIDGNYNRSGSLKFLNLAPIPEDQAEYSGPTDLTLNNPVGSSDPHDQGFDNDQLSKLLLSKSSEAKEAGRSPARQDQDLILMAIIIEAVP